MPKLAVPCSGLGGGSSFWFGCFELRDACRPQQSTRLAASPPSLVSLYLALMSLPVSARVLIVVSRSTRCREAISFVAIMYAVQAFTAPNAQRSMHGTCT